MTATVTNNNNSNNIIKSGGDFKFKIINFLNSVWALVVVSFLIVFGWAIKFPYVSIALLTVYEVSVLFLCPDNPKAILLPIISVPYMVNTFFGLFNWIYYITCILLFLISISVFIYRQIKINKKPVVKGSMFWAFVLSAVGNLLAGVIGHFNIINFLVTLVLSFIVYGVYWFCLNFLKDCKKYIAYCFVFLSLIIIAQMLIFYITTPSLSEAIKNKLVRIGTGEINTAAIYLTCGVCACFYLATGHKKDYLYLLLALFFNIAIFFTYSRMALLVSVLVSIVYFFFVLKKSENKKAILIVLLSLIAVGILGCIVFYKTIYSLVSYYIGLAFQANGRLQLWPWCWEQFKQNPIFGIGFTTSDPGALRGDYPGLTDLGGYSFVSCHNFFLHYLTCTGVVGLLLNVLYYYKKYCIVFKNFDTYKLFGLMVYISIFILSLFDATPNITMFNIVFSTILLALLEKENLATTDNITTNQTDNLATEQLKHLEKEQNTKEQTEQKPVDKISKPQASQMKTSKTKISETKTGEIKKVKQKIVR